jgi:cell division septation protein DedD
MSDQNVREIQLGGKQLVFLFMASVVLAVAIFLLGISVGRGVGAPTDEAVAPETAAAEPAPIEMPPPTETSPADLGYHDKLQGQTSPPAQALPPTETPKLDASPVQAGTTAVPVTPPATMPAAARSTAAPPPAVTTKPAATSTGPGWYAQVAAFKSRENADRQASQLKAKGYSAVVQADPGSLFRVRIGPFPERADAVRAAERLQREDGIRASIGR